MSKKLKNPKKADLNKDGKLSGYEKKRGMAIEKSMNVKMGSMIRAANGELIPYRKFKQKKLEQNFEQGKKDPSGKSLKNKPPAKVTSNVDFEYKKRIKHIDKIHKAAKKAIAEYPEKKRKHDRMIMRQFKKDILAVDKVSRAVGKTVPFVSKTLGALGSLVPTKMGNAELKKIERKKYGGSVGVKMAKGGFKKKTPIY